MNSYMYQDKHASIHVANVHDTYKHKDGVYMIHTYLIVDKWGEGTEVL